MIQPQDTSQQPPVSLAALLGSGPQLPRCSVDSPRTPLLPEPLRGTESPETENHGVTEFMGPCEDGRSRLQGSYKGGWCPGVPESGCRDLGAGGEARGLWGSRCAPGCLWADVPSSWQVLRGRQASAPRVTLRSCSQHHSRWVR